MDYLNDFETKWQQYEREIAIRAELLKMKQELDRVVGKDFGFPEQNNDNNNSNYTANDLENVLAELNDLVGMKNVKEDVQTQINLLKIKKIRLEKGLANIPLTLHSVFWLLPALVRLLLRD